MLTAFLFALPLLGGEPETLLPRPESTRLLPESAVVAAAQGRVLEQHPRFFVSVGWSYIDGQVAGPIGADPENENGFSATFGAVSWQENFGVAVELGAIVSSYDLKVSAIDTDKVDAQRFLVGLRLIDANWSRVLWHARLGGMYRQDRGDVISDEGFGWYAGGGVEWKLGPVSIGPEFLYAKTDSVNSAEWILGINGTLGF